MPSLSIAGFGASIGVRELILIVQLLIFMTNIMDAVDYYPHSITDQIIVGGVNSYFKTHSDQNFNWFSNLIEDPTQTGGFDTITPEEWDALTYSEQTAFFWNTGANFIFGGGITNVADITYNSLVALLKLFDGLINMVINLTIGTIQPIRVIAVVFMWISSIGFLTGILSFSNNYSHSLMNI